MTLAGEPPLAAPRAGTNAAEPRALKAQFHTAMRAGDWAAALAAGLRAAARDPADFPFVQGVVEALARCPDGALPAAPAMPPAASRPSLAVVIVSSDDGRYQVAAGEYARVLADWPHECIRVKGARSMYEGYARGFAQTLADVVVFSHDDVRIATDDFAARLARALESADVVGVAGTTRLSGPALNWSGHPHLFGSVVHYDPVECRFGFWAYSLDGPVISGAQALDGVFIAARREWIARVGFDPDGFPGFHFYDLDFSYRAHLAGARVAIAADLGLVHLSMGTFDGAWVEAQGRFARKHALAMAVPQVARHFYGAWLPDVAAAGTLYARLSAARAVALD